MAVFVVALHAQAVDSNQAAPVMADNNEYPSIDFKSPIYFSSNPQDDQTRLEAVEKNNIDQNNNALGNDELVTMDEVFNATSSQNVQQGVVAVSRGLRRKCLNQRLQVCGRRKNRCCAQCLHVRNAGKASGWYAPFINYHGETEAVYLNQNKEIRFFPGGGQNSGGRFVAFDSRDDVIGYCTMHNNRGLSGCEGNWFDPREVRFSSSTFRTRSCLYSNLFSGFSADCCIQ